MTLSGAVRVFFELPALGEDLRSSLTTQEHDGEAVLIFNEVKFGHGERYLCHAVSNYGTEKTGIIELKISNGHGKNEIRLLHMGCV